MREVKARHPLFHYGHALIRPTPGLFTFQERPMSAESGVAFTSLLFFALSSGLALSGTTIFTLMYHSHRDEMVVGLFALLFQASFSLWMLCLPLLPKRATSGTTRRAYRYTKNALAASELTAPAENQIRFLSCHKGNSSAKCVQMLSFGSAYLTALLFIATPVFNCLMEAPASELIEDTEKRCFNELMKCFTSSCFVVHLFKVRKMSFLQFPSQVCTPDPDPHPALLMSNADSGREL